MIFVQVFPPLKGIYIKFPENSCQDLRALAPDVEELLSTYQLTLQELRVPEVLITYVRFLKKHV